MDVFVQSAAVGAAAAINAGVASLMESLTMIAPAVYRGKTTSAVVQAWDPVLSRSVRPPTAFLHYWLLMVIHLTVPHAGLDCH